MASAAPITGDAARETSMVNALNFEPFDTAAAILDEARGILDTITAVHSDLGDANPLNPCELKALYAAERLIGIAAGHVDTLHNHLLQARRAN